MYMRVLLIILVVLFSVGSNSANSAGLSVNVSGVDGDMLKNVEQLLSIRQLLTDQPLLKKATLNKISEIDERSVSRLPRLHRAADQEILAALQPFGFYRPEISKSLVRDGEVWNASYTIALGVPVLLDEISVTVVGDGTLEPGVQAALQDSPLQKGEPLLHGNYAKQKSSLLDAAVEAGYLDATYTKSQLGVNPDTAKASIVLALDTKARYYFGEVQFDQTILSDELVSGYIPFSPGDPFNATQLIDLQLAIGESKYYDRVDISADRELAVDNKIPVLIDATPSKARQYTVSFGYGTDTGPRVKFGTEFRRVNKRGHRIRTDLLLSAIKRSASASYEIPLGTSGIDSLRFLSRYEEENVGDIDTKRLVLGASYNDTWRIWQRRLYLNYSQEKFEFGDNRNSIKYLTPGVTLSYAKADNLLLPRVGYSWLVDVHGASGSVLSDSTFLRGRVVGQRVWSPSEKSRLLVKTELGATQSDTPEDLPTASRFFAGGDRSLRGYRYQSIGPTDEEGNTVGGKYLARLSLEVDYLVLNDIGGAVFADMGDAANDTDFDLKRAVGVGLRWRSPVGMFRLDVAKPLDNSEDSYRLHISIGADL